MSEEKFMHEGLVVKIIQDEDAESPKDMGDPENLFLVGFHRQFDVRSASYPGIRGPDDVRHGGWSKNYHVFALNAYIHGGVALSLGTFSCPWDSGQVGYVLVRRLSCWKKRDKAEAAALSLVEEWNQYLSGDVWGYVVEDTHGNQLDSCWGFYGQKWAVEEAKSAAEACAASIREDDAKLSHEMAL